MPLSDRKLNIEYAAVQAFYWMGFCVCLTYATVYLQGRGYSNLSLGLVLAAGNISGFLLSPALASLVDRGRGVTVYGCLWGLIAAQMLLLFSFTLIRGSGLLMSVLYCLYIAANTAVNPLNTQLSFEMGGWTGRINYGAARGMGSFAFASTTMLLGSLTASRGSGILPYMGLCCLLLQSCALLVVSIQGKRYPTQRPEGLADRQEPSSALGFFRANPRFCVLLLGLALVFFAHNLAGNFLINVVRNLGGDSAAMGRVNGFMALLELPVMLLYSAAARRLRCTSLLRFSLLMFAVKALGVALAPTIGWLYAAQSANCLSFGILTPALVQYTGLVVGPKDSAKAQALSYGMSTLGSAFAGGLGGWMYDQLSVQGTLLIGAAFAALGALVCELSIDGRRNG